MLMVVMAIILWLAAKNWKTVAPTALEIQRKNRGPAGGHEVQPETYQPPAASTNGDAWTETPPARPSLGEMEKRTDAHSAAVQDALKQSQ